MMRDSSNVIRGFGVTQLFAFVVWVTYHVARLCLGLVVHPYRTTREIMRGVWFIPLVLLPAGLLTWVFASGRVASWAIDVPVAFRDALGLFFATLILSLGFWQALLLYLVVRFFVGFRNH